MSHWLTRRVFVLLLGLFVGLGMSLSAVQAGDMAVKMAVASDMGGAGSHGCGGCSGAGDDGKISAGLCLPGCITPMVAVVPPAAEMTVAPVAFLVLPTATAAHSRPSSPDPYPPRFRNPA